MRSATVRGMSIRGMAIQVGFRHSSHRSRERADFEDCPSRPGGWLPYCLDAFRPSLSQTFRPGNIAAVQEHFLELFLVRQQVQSLPSLQDERRMVKTEERLLPSVMAPLLDRWLPLAKQFASASRQEQARRPASVIFVRLFDGAKRSLSSNYKI